MSSILSDITAKRNLGGETVVVTQGAEIPVVIGTSRGANTQVSAPEAVTHDASHVDTLTNSPIREIDWVNKLVTGGGRSYTEDIHFAINSGLTGLDWSNAPALSPGAIDSITKVLSGGLWSVSGDVAWAITCFDGDSNETTEGVYIAKSITALTDSFTVKFAKPAGAGTTVRIYRTTTFVGGEPVFSSGDVVYFTSTGTSFTDTGASGTSGNPPTSNTAKDRPAVGSTYYVNYKYAVYTYQTPQLFTNIDAIVAAHGKGSNLTNAGILAIGRNGKGNEAPAVVLVAVENDDVTDYQDALSVLEQYPYGNYIVCLKHNASLDESGKLHAVYMSGDDVKKERFYVSCPQPGIEIGDESTQGTIIYTIKSYLGSNRVVVPVLEGNTYILNSWQETDGSYTEDYELTGNAQFFAVAVAARKCAQPDVAEDLTGKQIIGFNIPDTNQHWSVLEKESIVTAGGFFVEDILTNAVVNRAITTSLASVQDQTLSIMSAEDDLRRSVRAAGVPFRGKKITDNRISAFKTYTKGVLDAKVQAETISDYDDLETFQDSTNDQKLVAQFRYEPMYSAIWIEFSYGFIP